MAPIANLDSRQFSVVLAGTNGGSTIGINAWFLAMAWIFLSLRLYTRAVIHRSVRSDDWIMIIAVVCPSATISSMPMTNSYKCLYTVYVVCSIVINIRVHSTNGSVQWHNLAVAATLLNIAEEFYVLCIMTTKISLGIFIHRFTNKQWQRMLIYVSLGIYSLISMATFFFAVFQCGIYHDVNTFILRRLQGKCASDAADLGISYAQSGLTAFTDWMFLGLPVFILTKSLMSRSEKIAVMAILMFASVSGVASIIRLFYVDILAVRKADFFVHARNLGLWSCVEPGVAIIAGCAITLRPLFRSNRVRMLSSHVFNIKTWQDKSPGRGRSSKPTLRKWADCELASVKLHSPSSAMSKTASTISGKHVDIASYRLSDRDSKSEYSHHDSWTMPASPQPVYYQPEICDQQQKRFSLRRDRPYGYHRLSHISSQFRPKADKAKKQRQLSGLPLGIFMTRSDSVSSNESL